MSSTDEELRREVERRRTFAIISHPDAGKTTLTEKLLLFGGCIEVAGAVRGRKSQRAATSDWMELEKQRGISVSSTVLTFEYRGIQVNLLDTPGHHDFSEDTYRTLMAADGAVMVVDMAKGIESQTEKLFRVCALRRIPVITFVNKVDRPGRAPLEILAEIEQKFGIDAVACNWPIGAGHDFRGVVDMARGEAHLFENLKSDYRVGFESIPLERLGEKFEGAEAVVEEVELVGAAGVAFDRQRFLEGKLTPVYFGSALQSFGIEQFLNGFLEHCPAPQDRMSDVGPISATRPEFSGFVFKIQANLDPKHRDRIAFIRICSGKFRRDMDVVHARTGKRIRLRRAHKVFGQDRETMDEAYAGDVIGLINPGEFRLGDTICEGKPVQYEPLPAFSPENFAVLRCVDTERRKQFQRGIEQLLEEGAVQWFHDPNATAFEPMLGAVGELQFDVVRFRLESEYDTKTEIRWLPYKLARWIDGDPSKLQGLRLPYAAKMVKDRLGNPALLFQSVWDADYVARENPDVRFTSVSTAARAVDAAVNFGV